MHSQSNLHVLGSWIGPNGRANTGREQVRQTGGGDGGTLSAMRNALALAVVVGSSSLLGFACGGGGKEAVSPPPAGSEPRVVIEDSKEVWYEEESGKAGDKGSTVREFKLDVTKHVEWKGGGGTMVDAGAPPADRVFRVFVRFPVPKVMPKDARDPHAINRLIWDVRGEIAKCYYKGPGREAGEELSLVAFLEVDKAGVVKNGGIEKSDEALKKSGADECILENIKGMAFTAAGDDTKIRFKLKLQTAEVTGQADVKPAK